VILQSLDWILESPMPGHIRERHLVVPVLLAAAESPGGYISTAELIGVLETEFNPDGEDSEILPELDDTRFAQKVHNLVARRGSQTSMFGFGYAEHVDQGIRITNAGRAFLAQVPDCE
jgi:hypothetical protein